MRRNKNLSRVNYIGKHHFFKKPIVYIYFEVATFCLNALTGQNNVSRLYCAWSIVIHSWRRIEQQINMNTISLYYIATQSINTNNKNSPKPYLIRSARPAVVTAALQYKARRTHAAAGNVIVELCTRKGAERRIWHWSWRQVAPTLWLPMTSFQPRVDLLCAPGHHCAPPAIRKKWHANGPFILCAQSRRARFSADAGATGKNQTRDVLVLCGENVAKCDQIQRTGGLCVCDAVIVFTR
jgi:hypothetical protein